MNKLQGIDSIREKIRQRDNFTCQNCNKLWITGQRRFDVHHLVPEMESVKYYAYDRDNMDKLITYCHKCHMQIHFLQRKTTLIKQKFIKPVIIKVTKFKKPKTVIYKTTTITELISAYKKFAI